MADERVVIVTGGGTGIGAATTRLLSADGHHVVIGGRRPGPLRQVADETGALAHAVDLTDASAVQDLVETTVSRWGRLDGLVLNAGVGRGGAVGDLSDETWDLVIRTNLTAPFQLLRAALPHLLKARGSVVAVASVSALRNGKGNAAYATSKAALLTTVRPRRPGPSPGSAAASFRRARSVRRPPQQHHPRVPDQPFPSARATRPRSHPVASLTGRVPGSLLWIRSGHSHPRRSEAPFSCQGAGSVNSRE
ncbi:SDR family oxidoreductase [Streptomyces sp. NPDC005538]|uniref:SDR family NAD(P)-dependent oxidoreductase n=1 Tax=unclassified Streptomyces TaxID=2593676 RepID=UPI0033B1EA48